MRERRNLNKRITSIIMMMVLLVSIIPATSFANETKIFYGGNRVGYADYCPQISVSGIIGKDPFTDKIASESEMLNTEGYFCQAPVTIELLGDNVESFEANQLIPGGDNLYASSIYFYPEGNLVESEKWTAEEGWVSVMVPDGYKEDCFARGTKIIITKPGIYCVLASAKLPENYGEDGNYPITDTQIILNIKGEAQPTASKVYVNGKETKFEAYNIAGNNYFKIRDIAMAISGSEKQYNVIWDAEKAAINLLKNTPYTPVGSEFANGNGAVMTAQATTSHIYLDGQITGFTSYNIGGSNYYMLRDLGEVFDFAVEWNNETKSIHIDTTKAYTKD
jgi:hypothetical protein